KSLLCLAADRHGLLYAGTDTDGLVLRIDPANGAAYVLYDAKEAEISALAIDTNTNVYAATASAAAAKPGRTLGEKPGGKPESAPAVEDRPSPTAMTLPAALAEAIKQKAAGSAPTTAGPAEGNAIYRIDRDGFITEVFREPVMILALHEEAGTLYAATGNEGRIYEIVPADEVTMNVAKLESSQAVSLIRLDDGSFIIGAANEGAIARMAPGFADKGTFVCKPLDAGQIVRFGRVRWRADVPGGTKLSLATRSGNVEDPDDATWGSWSDEVDATNSAQIASPSARFLQYRLTFETTNPKRSAVLSQLDVARLEDNRPPVIAALRVGSAKELAAQPTMAALKAKLGPMLSKPDGQQNVYAIAWQAQDPNSDELIYDIYYRQTGFRRWIRLEEDFKETVTLWDTQSVPDGEYRVRVVAKDAPDNPVNTALSYARVSEPVIVDNTPPVIRIERFQVDGKTLRIRATVKDALLPLASARYTMNSHDEWKVIAPADDIFDSPEETLEFVIEDLEVGEHVVAIAVADKNDNTTFVTRAVSVEP
ncbi:MAG: hypothetical protein JXA69_05355, partial [Phycisphaerae bacterium]|nr:hypothetical protein [Phycisphaerae bacterium]